MKLSYETPNESVLRSLIAQKGYGIMEFSQMLYGDEKRRNVLGELKNRPDMRSSTLVKICRLLDIPMDVLFSDGTGADESLSVQTNDTSFNGCGDSGNTTELLLLKSQLESQKLLLAEKDARIEELKKYNEDLRKRLDLATNQGRG